MTVIWNADVYIDKVDKNISWALQDSANLVINEAKRLVAVDTGTLKDSISMQLKEEDNSVRIGSDVPYAYYQEVGTRKMGPQPYLRPALTTSMPQITEIFNSAMKV